MVSPQASAMAQPDQTSTHWQTFWIHAKQVEKGASVHDTVQDWGFQPSSTSPDFVITVGGDGTFLQAEHRYPGIPKLLVRDSLVCYRCHNEPLPILLEYIRQGRATTMAIPKLEVGYARGCLTVVNDIVLRNQHPTQALRYRVSVNRQVVADQVIGDGVVAATPFGATGYFHSVTGQTFDQGMGLAFNNPTEPRPPLIVDSQTEISIDIIRGPGQLAGDNIPQIYTVTTDEQVVIRQSPQMARLVAHH